MSITKKQTTKKTHNFVLKRSLARVQGLGVGLFVVFFHFIMSFALNRYGLLFKVA